MPVDTGFVEDNKILFLIKFQKRKFLEEIISGLIRFSPSQKYIEQEQLLHDKGQGDLLEGKMLIRSKSAVLRDTNTDDVICACKNYECKIAIQNVNDMPITCFLHGTVDDCCEYHNRDNYTIKLSNNVERTIREDFHNPDSALIILNPQKYIADMKSKLNTVASSIRYYNYDIQTVQRYKFLCSGDENGDLGPLLYKNRYRHLLCKDISFKNQKEYRFIRTDKLIQEPEKYDFPFDYDYRLISCKELFSGYRIS